MSAGAKVPGTVAYECPDHPYHPHPGMCMCILPHALCGKEQVAVISRAETVAWLRAAIEIAERGDVYDTHIEAIKWARRLADALERGEEGR